MRSKKAILFLIVSLCIVIIVPFIIAKHNLGKERYYTFDDKATFNKCRKLLFQDKDGYLLYKTFEKNGMYCLQIRDLIDNENQKEIMEFGSRADRERFIKEKTISVDGKLPPLNYDSTFSDNGGKGPYSVSYRLRYEYPKDVFKEASVMYIAGFAIWLIVIWL